MTQTHPAELFRVERVRGEVVVTFTRPDLVDEDAAWLLGERLFTLAEGEGGSRFVLDFGPVVRVSSATLGKLIAFRRRVKQAGGEVALRSLSAGLAATFRCTRLDTVFRILPGG